MPEIDVHNLSRSTHPPADASIDTLRWAAFCAASVEWLCARYRVACPSWVYHSATACPNPGLTRLEPTSHRYANDCHSKRQSHSPGAISIAATACSPTNTNSLTNTSSMLCLLHHPPSLKMPFSCSSSRTFLWR